MFYQYTSGMGGTGQTMFFQQRFVHPDVHRVAAIANSDPYVLAFCQSRGISDAETLYNTLKQEGAAKYVSRMKLLQEDEVKRIAEENKLDPEMYPDPEPTTRRCKAFYAEKKFNDFCVEQLDGSFRYQCPCGLVSCYPRTAVPTDVGHEKLREYHIEKVSNLPPMKRKSHIKLRVKLHECEQVTESDGGIVTYAPVLDSVPEHEQEQETKNEDGVSQ